MTQIWLRPLSPEELKYFRKKEPGKGTIDWGPLSIMGPHDYSTVCSRHQHVASDFVDLGNLGVQDLSPGFPNATGGQKIELSHFETFIYHFSSTLSESNFSFITDSYGSYPVIYFSSRYTEMFIEALRYADGRVEQWDARRGFLDKIFGGTSLTIGDSVTISMKDGIRRILVESPVK